METITKTRSELETEIAKFIYIDNVNSCTVHFQYDMETNNGYALYVITHNPVHNNSFLYGKSWGITKEAALENFIKEHTVNNPKEVNSYTVNWQKIGDKAETSYFRGNDIYQILDKFYHNKNTKEYIIFEIRLNPIA